jgi:hypothetical protein
MERVTGRDAGRPGADCALAGAGADCALAGAASVPVIASMPAPATAAAIAPALRLLLEILMNHCYVVLVTPDAAQHEG